MRDCGVSHVYSKYITAMTFAVCNTLQHTATHCNTLQHTATHCDTLQYTAAKHGTAMDESHRMHGCGVSHTYFTCVTAMTFAPRNTLQHTATHCDTLQHTATHCNTLQHTAAHCNTLPRCIWVPWMTHTACLTASFYMHTQHVLLLRLSRPATHCNTLHHTATHCSALQYTATMLMTAVNDHTARMTAAFHTHTQHISILGPSRPAMHYNMLHHTAPHCTTLHHTAMHCNALQYTATMHITGMNESHHTHDCGISLTWKTRTTVMTVAPCNTLRHPATHYNTLEHPAKMHITAVTIAHCNTLQHTATHCNTLQHTATPSNDAKSRLWLSRHATHCSTLQHTATHWNRYISLLWLSRSTSHCQPSVCLYVSLPVCPFCCMSACLSVYVYLFVCVVCLSSECQSRKKKIVMLANCTIILASLYGLSVIRMSKQKKKNCNAGKLHDQYCLSVWSVYHPNVKAHVAVCCNMM